MSEVPHLHMEAYRRENVRYHRTSLNRLVADLEAVCERLETELAELRSDGGFETVIPDVAIAHKVADQLVLVVRRARASIILDRTR